MTGEGAKQPQGETSPSPSPSPVAGASTALAAKVETPTVSAAERALSPSDRYNRMTAWASVASVFVALIAAGTTVYFGYETAGKLKDQSSVQLLAGFGTAEVAAASQALAVAALDERAYLDGDQVAFVGFEGTIAPLKNQLLAVAECLDSGLCSPTGAVRQIFCDRASGVDAAVSAVYARTKVRPPDRADSYERAKRYCDEGNK